ACACYFLSASTRLMIVNPIVIINGRDHFRFFNSDVSAPTLALRARKVVSISDRAIPSLSVIASISSGPSISLSWYGLDYGLVEGSERRWNSTDKKSSP